MRQGLICLIAALLLAACQPPDPTPAPTLTATPDVTRTPFVMPTAYPSETPLPVTPSETAVLVDTFTGLVIEPPLSIVLPEGWTTYYDTALINEIGELNYVPIAVYSGPVTGGAGTIAMVWNFRSIASGNPFSEEFQKVNLLSDGERLLRTLVIELGCNVGLEPARTDLTLGGLPGTGRFWSAVTCPELPDTRGWYVAREDMEIGFVFYAFTEPITAMNGAAKDELQAILDTVVLRVAEVPTATPGFSTPMSLFETEVAPEATATP